jgi:hypothetical protein
MMLNTNGISSIPAPPPIPPALQNKTQFNSAQNLPSNFSLKR